MAKSESKPETSRKSKLIFIGALLVTVTVFFLISGFLRSGAVYGKPDESPLTRVFESGAGEPPVLSASDFTEDLEGRTEFSDISETASSDRYTVFELSGASYDMDSELILSLKYGSVSAFTLSFPIPEQPAQSGQSDILDDLLERETEQYKNGIQNITDTFNACAEILDTEESISYAALSSMNYLIGQTLEDEKQREEKSDAYVMTADVREAPDGKTLNLSLEIKGTSDG